jgi:nucleoside 2-deoxyribosyltransferase
MKIYFTAPQNTPYQREYVQACVQQLLDAGHEVALASDKYINHQPAFEVTLEANGEKLYSDQSQAGRLAKSAFAAEVFQENYALLAEADAVLALLDGSQVDDRVACEIGIFYGLMRENPDKKGIIGLATDARCLRRRDSTYGVNIFTVGTLEEVGRVVESIADVIEAMKSLPLSLRA